MLEPDSRVVLLDQLRPPPGYHLVSAVASTFTLDLTTALVPPLAFASFEIGGTPDPVAALEAVRSCTDRVDVFCQAGQLVVPRAHSDLMAYLEPMVHPVRRPRAGRLFHPKVWFLQYEADGQPNRFRLLCSSRNLTASNAWDAVVTLDGQRSGRSLSANRPLAALIRHLPDLAVRTPDATRTARIDALAEAAEQVEWEPPKDVTEVAFHAFGVPRLRATNPDFSGYRHLVVSPFCNDDGLEHLTGRARGDVAVVSRPEDLDRLDPAALGRAKTYVLNPLAVLNAPGADAEDAAASATPTSRPELDTLSGLHAKVTVVERAWKAHVFIGSPNATGPAFGGNVEFAVELIGSPTRLGVNTYLNADAPFAGLLQEYEGGAATPPDPDDELLEALKNELRALSEVLLTLTVEPAGAHGYGLRLQSARPIRPHAGYGVRVELLTRAGHAQGLAPGERVDVAFADVPLADITPFVVLFVRDEERSTATKPLEVSTVVHAALVGDPPSRLDEVLARQVDTPEKFLRFLALLLGIGDGSPVVAGLGEDSGGQPWVPGGGQGAGIFEIVVNALADHPSSLRDFDRLVERLSSTESGRAVLPAGFEALWEPVRGALTELAEHP